VSGKTKSNDGPITIKKYANRRLYNTATSSYVTLDTLCEMVKQGHEFNVFDAKTNEDITRSVLTQIIVEEESKGQNLLPIQFLRQLIGFYGDQLQSAVPRYLEFSMESFMRNQEQLREGLTDSFGGGQPFKFYEDLARQNTALFQDTWMEAYRQMMTFGGMAPGAPSPMGMGAPQSGSPEPNGLGNAPDPQSEEEILTLRRQVEAMQQQLNKLGGSSDKSD
jgi:polyhydroxyalkanoate synthesis repressor PhaR